MSNIDIDSRIEEHLMKEQEELIKNTEWILISDEPDCKKYVSKDNPNFFRSISFLLGPDNTPIKTESTWFEYCRKEVDF